jgi:ABC-type transport system substrate-binding protein
MCASARHVRIGVGSRASDHSNLGFLLKGNRGFADSPVEGDGFRTSSSARDLRGAGEPLSKKLWESSPQNEVSYITGAMWNKARPPRSPSLLKFPCQTGPPIFGGATRLEAHAVKGGVFVYGSYPDLDELYEQQAVELDRQKREAVLHKMQQIVYERTIYAPIWQLAFINGAGPLASSPF